MKESYKITVNDTYAFEFTEADLAQLDWIATKPNNYHLLQDHVSYKIAIENSDIDAKLTKLTVNNTNYTVAINTPLDGLIEDLGFALNAANQVSSIDAPMPGLILEVSVIEGQAVAEGDTLLILEAMKMENVISSQGKASLAKFILNKAKP